ncbi:MAG: RNA polymerase sigma factor SigJ [bacterium]
MPDAAFEDQRRRCLALAYRLLGSAADAEDIVQEAWLRWRTVDDIRQPAAWLTTTVTRLCLDHQKSARVRRETYVGPWLPEPLATTDADVDPDTVSMAFLLLLERLSPLERAVFLLRRVFDLDYAAVARTLDRSEAAIRQLAHRADAHLRAARPRYAPTRDQHQALLLRFLMATQAGDLAPLQALLAEDATAWTDSGGHVRAARRVVRGRLHVARLFQGLARKPDSRGLQPELRQLNGWPAVILRRDEAVETAILIETDGALIYAVHVVRNPEKLRGLAR